MFKDQYQLLHKEYFMFTHLSHLPRTVKVQHAIGVLVSVLQQLINFVVCDGFPAAADDQGELVSVDVSVTVPAGTREKIRKHKHKREGICKTGSDPNSSRAVDALVEHTEALCQLFLALAGLVLLEQPHHHDQELLEVDATAA